MLQAQHHDLQKNRVNEGLATYQNIRNTHQHNVGQRHIELGNNMREVHDFMQDPANVPGYRITEEGKRF